MLFAISLDGDRLYVISGLARVVCMKARTGEQIWAVDAGRDFHAEFGRWGIAESPLVFDDKIICTPGGPDTIVVALDKMTGRVIWTAQGVDEKSAYCSPQLARAGDRALVVTMTDKNTLGIDADGMLYCYEEKQGALALVNADPKGFDVVSSFQITAGGGKHWAHPVVCGGRLYVRHGDTLLVYDVKGPAA